MRLLEKLSTLISKYMALLIVIVTLLALCEPPTFRWAATEIPLLLGIAMFGMGMTLRLQDFQLVLQRPQDVLSGVALQFTVMPSLAWMLATVFDLPTELAAGVILVGTCPGGTASNIMTYLAKGDVALSVSMTMTTTILAPVITPLLTLWLAGAWIEVSFAAMMLSILQVVIAPIVLGLLINSFRGNWVCKIEKLLPLVSITAIIFIVGGVVAVSAERIRETGLTMMAVVMLHNLLGYGLGFVAAKALKMNMAKTKAISIEVGMQNAGLASTLALLHFSAAAAIPGALFSVWHNISGSLAANFLAARQETRTAEKE